MMICVAAGKGELEGCVRTTDRKVSRAFGKIIFGL